MTQPTRAKCERKSKSADRGQALVDDWRQSGQSRTAYANRHNIGVHLLAYWSKRFPAPSDVAPKTITNHIRTVEPFVQIPMPSTHQGRIDICLVNGVVVRVSPGADPDLLRVAVQTLVGSAC